MTWHYFDYYWKKNILAHWSWKYVFEVCRGDVLNRMRWQGCSILEFNDAISMNWSCDPIHFWWIRETPSISFFIWSLAYGCLQSLLDNVGDDHDMILVWPELFWHHTECLRINRYLPWRTISIVYDINELSARVSLLTPRFHAVNLGWCLK